MKLFRRHGYEVTLNRVRDTVTIREGDEKLTLYVDSEINSIMKGIHEAEKLIVNINGESQKSERVHAARMFAIAIFGKEQTDKLFDFYHGNENCVISICGLYFSDKKHGLSRKIVKIQKKIK